MQEYVNALAANLVEAGEDEESEAFKRVHQLDVEICSLYAIVATGKRSHHQHAQRPLSACLVLNLNTEQPSSGSQLSALPGP